MIGREFDIGSMAPSLWDDERMSLATSTLATRIGEFRGSHRVRAYLP
jgi:hypothetical protein